MSGSSAGGSMGGSSSSGEEAQDGGVVDAGVDAGPSIPLEQLCERMMSPMISEAGDIPVTSLILGCGILTSEEIAEFAEGDRASRVALACGPHGAFKTGAAVLVDSVDAGTMLYDPKAAAECAAQGVQTYGQASMGFAHRDIALLAFLDVGWRALPSHTGACARVFQGTVPPGSPCRSDGECDTTQGRAACVERGGAACEGHCELLGTTIPCGSVGRGFECPLGLVCDDNRNCVPALSAGDACPEGKDLCAAGTFCLDGTCHRPSDVGGPCVVGSDLTCGTSYYCQEGPDGGTCAPPLSTGAPCDPNAPPPCAFCDVCKEQDAGFACTPRFLVNSACSAAEPCPVPYACSLGKCRAPVATGEACVTVDALDERLRGNCLQYQDSCVNTPQGRRCVRRSAAGEACEGDPVARAVQGSCARICDIQNGDDCLSASPTLPYALRTAVCSRPASSTRVGTCVEPALVGQACGNRYDHSPYCVTSAGKRALCAVADGGVLGTCVLAGEGNTGDPCASSEACVAGLYCAFGDGGVVGSCAAAGALDAPCGDGAPWGERCQEGACLPHLDEDAGETHLTCTDAYHMQGEDCLDLQECGPFQRCALLGDDAGVCAPLSNANEPCRETRDCSPEDPSVLECAHGTCVSHACALRINGGCFDLNAEGGQELPAVLPFVLMLGATVTFRRRRR